MKFLKAPSLMILALFASLGFLPNAHANLCSLDPESSLFYSTRNVGSDVEISICEFSSSEAGKLPLYRKPESAKCTKVAIFTMAELKELSTHESIIVIQDHLTEVAAYAALGAGLPSEGRWLLGKSKKIADHLKTFTATIQRRLSGSPIKPPVIAQISEKEIPGGALLPTIEKLKNVAVGKSQVSPMLVTNLVYYTAWIALLMQRWEKRVAKATETVEFLRDLEQSLNPIALNAYAGCIKVDRSPEQIAKGIRLAKALIEMNQAPTSRESTQSLFEGKFRDLDIEKSLGKLFDEVSENMIPALSAIGH